MRITTNASALEEIRVHLLRCDPQFLPPLSERVHIPAYAAKIRHKALTVEAWERTELVGLVAAYMDDARQTCYLTSVSVLPDWSGKGIATALLTELMTRAKRANVESVMLEVSKRNAAAWALYRKFGFENVGDHGDVAVMQLRPVFDLVNAPERSRG